jgi:DNA primase
MIKPESIKKLKEVVDIVEVVREYVPNLKRVGRNFFALCPFHSEKTPSFSVSPQHNFVHCFGCKYTADAIKFVQDIEHVNYYEAVEKLAKKYNVQIEYIDDEQQKILKEKYDEIKLLADLLTDVAEVYHELLLNSEEAAEARRYLVSRGVKHETVLKFKLGFAPAGDYIAKNYKSIPRLAKYDLLSLHKAGIINFSSSQSGLDKYEHVYDYFKDRIVFPIFNLGGKVVGFGGRIIPSKKPLYSDGDKPPVYINSPETPVFHKGNVLYGLFQSKEHIVKEKTVCVVEGYMDVLILFQEGIKTVVAPLGTALTEQQAKLLTRFADKIYLLFDPDEAGVEATLSAAKSVFLAGGYPYAVVIEQKDPDEYILQYGAEHVKDLITNSISVIKHVVQYYFKEKSQLSISEKISLLNKFMDVINVVTNPVVKSELIKEISSELKIDEQIIRSEHKKYNKIYAKTIDKIQSVISNRPYTAEEELLWICVHYPEMIGEISEEVFSHDNVYLEVFRTLRDYYLTSKDIDELISRLESPAKDIVIRLVFDSERNFRSSLEEKIQELFTEIFRIKMKKRYLELKPIVEEMLQEKVPLDPQIVNEFKQIVETLKLSRRVS